MSSEINIDELIDDFDSLTTNSFSPVFNKSVLQPHPPTKSKSPNQNPKNKFAVLPENLSPNSRKQDEDQLNSLLSEVLNSPVAPSSSSSSYNTNNYNIYNSNSYTNNSTNTRLFSPSPTEKISYPSTTIGSTYSSSNSRKNSVDDDLFGLLDDNDSNFKLPGMKSSSRPLSDNLSRPLSENFSKDKK